MTEREEEYATAPRGAGGAAFMPDFVRRLLRIGCHCGQPATRVRCAADGVLVARCSVCDHQARRRGMGA